MKRGVVRAREDKKGRGANAASPPKPPRSKTKRDAKIDGCKTPEKRIKNRGAKRQGEVGEGAAPKSEMQRGCGGGSGDRSRLFCLAETATPAMARPRGWGGVGTRSCGGTGRDRGPPGGGSALQQCGAGSRGAQSIYSAAPGVPAPFPPPQRPRLLAAGLGDFMHMQIWRKELGPPP